MSRFLSPTLEAVTPYTPGEQPQDQQYIKLNTNESPYLPSPAVVGAVSEAEVEKLRLYSDPACAELLRAAAAGCTVRSPVPAKPARSAEIRWPQLRRFPLLRVPLALQSGAGPGGPPPEGV